MSQLFSGAVVQWHGEVMKHFTTVTDIPNPGCGSTVRGCSIARLFGSFQIIWQLRDVLAASGLFGSCRMFWQLPDVLAASGCFGSCQIIWQLPDVLAASGCFGSCQIIWQLPDVLAATGEQPKGRLACGWLDVKAP